MRITWGELKGLIVEAAKKDVENKIITIDSLDDIFGNGGILTRSLQVYDKAFAGAPPIFAPYTTPVKFSKSQAKRFGEVIEQVRPKDLMSAVKKWEGYEPSDGPGRGWKVQLIDPELNIFARVVNVFANDISSYYSQEQYSAENNEMKPPVSVVYDIASTSSILTHEIAAKVAENLGVPHASSISGLGFTNVVNPDDITIDDELWQTHVNKGYKMPTDMQVASAMKSLKNKAAKNEPVSITRDAGAASIRRYVAGTQKLKSDPKTEWQRVLIIDDNVSQGRTFRTAYQDLKKRGVKYVELAAGYHVP